MRKTVRNTVLILFVILLFIPVFPVTIVPEWELRFSNENGDPIASVRVNQLWKDYSLEFWSFDENRDENLESDSNGYIKLPARQIQVSIFQVLSSQIRDLIMRINPHASFGSHSYIICRGIYTCVADYRVSDENVQLVIIK